MKPFIMFYLSEQLLFSSSFNLQQQENFLFNVIQKRIKTENQKILNCSTFIFN